MRAIGSNSADWPPKHLNRTPTMTIFIIILFCLCAGYLVGVAHRDSEPDNAQACAACAFCVCLALVIPLVYQVGRYIGLWA